MKTVTVYTDGACSGNPGPGGWGAILIYGKWEKVMSGGVADTTNNRMELTAVVRALSVLTEPCIVELYSDSKYVVDALEKGWALKWRSRNWVRPDRKPALNPDLWEPMLRLADMHELHCHWVKGHDANPYNNRCDAMAVKESKKFIIPPRNIATEMVPEAQEETNTAPAAAETSEASAAVTPEPSVTKTPEASATKTPEASAAVTPEPSVTKTPEASAAVTPEPSVTKTPEASAAVTPEPSAAVTPEPSVTKTPEASAAVTPEPSVTKTPEPSAAVTPEPSVTKTPEPSATKTPEAVHNALKAAAEAYTEAFQPVSDPVESVEKVPGKEEISGKTKS